MVSVKENYDGNYIYVNNKLLNDLLNEFNALASELNSVDFDVLVPPIKITMVEVSRSIQMRQVKLIRSIIVIAKFLI